MAPAGAGFRVAEYFAREAALAILAPPFALQKTDMQMLWHGRAHLDPAHKWLRGLPIRAAEGI